MSTRCQFKNLLLLCAASASLLAAAADNPFLGEWALTVPGNHAGWLGVQERDGGLSASMMWGFGSVESVASARLDGARLILTRKYTVERKNAEGKKIKEPRTETVTATTEGDVIKLVSAKPREDAAGENTIEFSGRRQPPMPPAPDLDRVRFGDPVKLFNGVDLTGWRLTDPKAVNGWSVKDGLLVNTPVQEDKKHPKSYGNLRTDQEFEDFNLKVEVQIGKGENSGVYVRGIYEVQVEDSYGQPTDPHHLGAVYSRIKPTVAAEKPPGQWQTLDITFVDRHVTVVLNGQKIIDNQPVLGCTGGALWSDVTRPGPIYLQGDHTGITYRSLVLRPVLR